MRVGRLISGENTSPGAQGFEIHMCLRFEATAAVTRGLGHRRNGQKGRLLQSASPPTAVPDDVTTGPRSAVPRPMEVVDQGVELPGRLRESLAVRPCVGRPVGGGGFSRSIKWVHLRRFRCYLVMKRMEERET